MLSPCCMPVLYSISHVLFPVFNWTSQFSYSLAIVLRIVGGIPYLRIPIVYVGARLDVRQPSTRTIRTTVPVPYGTIRIGRYACLLPLRIGEEAQHTGSQGPARVEEAFDEKRTHSLRTMIGK